MEIRSMGRATQGVQVMTKLSEDDRVISMSAFKERTWEDFEQISTTPVKTKEITSPQAESLDEESEETDEVEVTIEDEEDAQSQLVMELPTEEEPEEEIESE